MESFGVINYLTYVFGAVMIVLLPGPNSLYVLSLSAQQGVKNGWSAACGVFLGDSILMLLTALGAVTLLKAYPTIFITIKIAGALYLAYIGIRLLVSAWREWKNQSLSDIQSNKIKKTSPKAAFTKALVVSLLNPKAILFLLSFFVQFVDPSYPSPAIPFLILAITLQICSVIYLGLLIYAGNKLADIFKKRKKVTAMSNGSVGAVFMLFAIKLALASSI